MSASMKRVYYWVPVAREPKARMVSSFEHARVNASLLKMAEFTPADWDWSGFSIEAKRNRAVARFLKSPCEFLLMVDDDMDFNFDPDGIAKLVACAEDTKADIVGPLMVRRGHPHDVAFNEVRFKPDTLKDVLEYATKGMSVEVKGHIGTGCLLIHRRVFSGIKAPWFITDQSTECMICDANRLNSLPVDPKCGRCNGTNVDPDGCWTRIGEDASFCHKAIDAGFKCVLAAHVIVGHVGDESFTFEDTIRTKDPVEYAVGILKERAPERLAKEAPCPAT